MLKRRDFVAIGFAPGDRLENNDTASVDAAAKAQFALLDIIMSGEDRRIRKLDADVDFESPVPKSHHCKDFRERLVSLLYKKCLLSRRRLNKTH